jgi:chromosome partitioning protein
VIGQGSAQLQGNTEIRFVVSRKIGRTVLGRDIADALAEFEIPILHAGTTQRVAYAETLTGGSTVIEQQPNGPERRRYGP